MVREVIFCTGARSPTTAKILHQTVADLCLAPHHSQTLVVESRSTLFFVISQETTQKSIHVRNLVLYIFP